MGKRNGLSDSFVAGKRNHTFTRADIDRKIRYMEIRKYCLKKMQNTQEFRQKDWTMTDYNTRIYMQGIFDACDDFLGWGEGRIDND